MREKINPSIKEKGNEQISMKTKYITYCTIVSVLIFGLTIMILFLIYQDEAIKELYKYRDFITHNVILSLIILTVLHIIASILFIPSALFAIMTGFIFATFMPDSWEYVGYVLSLITFLLIQGLSGCIVFNISSFFFGKKIREEFIQKNDKLLKLDKVMNFYGTKALFLFRLSPLVPVTLLNYILGGFNITSRMFFLSSFGSFPGELFTCYLGFNAMKIDKMLDDKQKNMIMLIITLVGGIILIAMICVFAKLSQVHFNNLVDKSTKVEDGEMTMNDKNNIELDNKDFI